MGLVMIVNRAQDIVIATSHAISAQPRCVSVAVIFCSLACQQRSMPPARTSLCHLPGLHPPPGRPSTSPLSRSCRCDGDGRVVPRCWVASGLSTRSALCDTESTHQGLLNKAIFMESQYIPLALTCTRI